MKTNRALVFFFALAITLAPGSVPGQTDREDPARFSVSRLSPRFILVTDTKMNNNVAAIRTSGGVVVVDTDESVEAGRAVRRILEREFPGETFAYVINTHSHWDHVLGNPAFPEALIVAHENCRRAMMKVEPEPARPEVEGRPGGEAAVGAKREQSPAKSGPPPPPAPGGVGVAAEHYAATVPDLTFSDGVNVHCGDATFGLMHFGRAHTLSDILVIFPEEKVLFVGDLFFKAWLPVFNEWIPPDIDRWRGILDEVLREPALVETVVSGHGEPFTRAEFETQVRYRLDLWDGVAQAVRAGKSLEDVQREFSLRVRFPGLEPWNLKDDRGRPVHEENIRKIWKHLKEN